MRKSRAITLTVLSGLIMTACCITSGGCGARTHPPPDHVWYDANGNRIEERWKTDENGQLVLDEQGRTIPEPGVPHDNYGRPWEYRDGAWSPQPAPTGYSRAHSSYWWWGGTGYRSTGGTSYRPAVSGTGSGSGSPSRSATPSSGSGSVSRGGFGSTGMGASGS